MRKALSLGVAAFLVCSVGHAAAQPQPTNQETSASRQKDDVSKQGSEQVAPMHTVPPPGPASNPESPESEYLKPGSVGPSQAATPGGGDQPDVPGATRQTLPSTVSAENAEQDKRPIMSFGFPLSDEQKRTIAAGLDAAPNAGAKSDAKINAHVADAVPPGTELRAFPEAVTKEIPEAVRYKYVDTGDRILIVNPPNGIVVGEIAH